MLYKFINENKIEPASEMKIAIMNNRVITNPYLRGDEFMRQFGYTDLLKNDPPLFDDQTQYLSETYSMSYGIIKNAYEIKNIEGEASLNG